MTAISGTPTADDGRGARAFVGRPDECATIDRLLAGVRGGVSGALVVRGEPGIGKTELLRYAEQAAAPDCRVARAVGVESEMELAYAGLHQLCAPMLDRRDRLPLPQRAALEAAFALSSGSQPDQFFVALAVLGLLSDAAAERPLVCVLDDAQWLDRTSVQALAFVARRLGMESVALLFAARAADDELSGLPELRLGALSDRHARALLRSVFAGPLDERVADRILAEAGGNPLALLELPRGLSPAELAGGYVAPNGAAVPGRIEESYRRRLEDLPADSRRLLLLAAAEPVGDGDLLWRAAERLGIPPSAADIAERAELIGIGAQVRFRHPLVRSAIYRAAAPDELRAVHRALGLATDPAADPDRRAWHRANAVTGPDETVAVELERSAGRAQRRGGLAAAAAFLERATTLSDDALRRAERALRAAQAKLDAGSPSAALDLLELAEKAPLEPLQRAHAERLRGRAAFASDRGVKAAPLLLRAARRFEGLDARLARDTYLDALQAAMVAGSLGNMGFEVAAAARAAPPAPDPPLPADSLLDGIATLFTDGHAAAAPALATSLAETPDETWTRWPWFVALIAWTVWDVNAYTEIAARQVALAREAGLVSTLLPALSMLEIASVHAGEFASARQLLDESEALAEATGTSPWPYARVVLAGWRGREQEAVATMEAAVHDALAHGEGLLLAFVDLFTAVLRNGLGDYTAALAASRRAAERIHLGFVTRALPELVEAAARTGERAVAEEALDRLREATRPHPTSWALGVQAYATALLADGAGAKKSFRAAIEHLGDDAPKTYLARAHLLYGEWLRRERRRGAAREQLQRASELFTAMGAEAFAARAAQELLATGATARRRAGPATDELTAREAQIAQLAAQGLSNPEIGGRLFISPRTVEYHLAKVFAKLGIRSRAQLEAFVSVDDADGARSARRAHAGARPAARD